MILLLIDDIRIWSRKIISFVYDPTDWILTNSFLTSTSLNSCCLRENQNLRKELGDGGGDKLESNRRKQKYLNSRSNGPGVN